MRGHYEGDPAKYRELSQLAEWKKKDPIARVARALKSKKAITDKELAAIESEARALADKAAAFSLSSPWPAGSKSTVRSTPTTNPYGGRSMLAPIAEPQPTMPEQTYLEAIRAGLEEELRRDPAVYVFGEDVALGGPFGVTKGLAGTFGVNRTVNTPISEATVMGLAIGTATAGLRPVIEIMFIDFITLAMDQLINHAAKLHYMSGGQLKIPLTVRVQCGISGAMGAHHSQSLESWLAHVPGLKVVMPANPADAKGL